jgi:hypothetical protein
MSNPRGRFRWHNHCSSHNCMPALPIAAWIAFLITAGALAAAAVRLSFWAYDRRNKRKPRQGFSAPRKTLRFIAKRRGGCSWRIGKRGDARTMQIVGSMLATNISSVPALVAQAELRFGFRGRKRISGMVMVSGSTHEKESCDIPPGETRDVTFEFWLYPPVRDSWETFTPRSVTFIDQFGNKHVVDRLTFIPHTTPPSARPAVLQEFVCELR